MCERALRLECRLQGLHGGGSEGGKRHPSELLSEREAAQAPEKEKRHERWTGDASRNLPSEALLNSLAHGIPRSCSGSDAHGGNDCSVAAGSWLRDRNVARMGAASIITLPFDVDGCRYQVKDALRDTSTGQQLTCQLCA
jgi:hypothetical protein